MVEEAGSFWCVKCQAATTLFHDLEIACETCGNRLPAEEVCDERPLGVELRARGVDLSPFATRLFNALDEPIRKTTGADVQAVAALLFDRYPYRAIALAAAIIGAPDPQLNRRFAPWLIRWPTSTETRPTYWSSSWTCV